MKIILEVYSENIFVVKYILGRKQKEILKVYGDHLANQEAEISQLESVLSEFRIKIGDLGLNDSVASQKADIEKELQDKRRENQTLSLSLNTREEEIAYLQSSLKQMETGLQGLTSENSGLDLDILQVEIDELEATSKEIDNELKEKETKINDLLSTKQRGK